ncbi:hypothetical protein [Modestobacter lacusdianchii]
MSVAPAQVHAHSELTDAERAWLGAAALAALVVAVQLQVRSIEEPYLRAVHGAAYLAFATRAGRFLPGIGRLPAPADPERIAA